MTEIVTAPALEMRGITKRYPGVVANDGIDLEVRPGEVHALLGENGAGKSTLMNILYGLATPDEGEIALDGRPVTISGPADAIARGISMVHQHFMLVPVLSVADNILLGEETMANPIFLDRNEANRRIIELGKRFGFDIDPDVKVGSLSVGWQQRVEILKALYREARILVLDEPTAVLTPQETKEIFEVLRRLASEGHSIIFISHKLYEVLEIADRITVIRRGKVVGSRVPAETDEDDLAALMVGRNVQLIVDRGESHPTDPRLVVTDLHVADDRGHEAVKGVSFDVRAGEILGIAGVAGNGQDELVEALTGLRKPTSGTVELAGHNVTGAGPRDLQRAGMSFVPGDRHRFGLVLSFPLEDNLVLTQYDEPPYARGILRNDAAIHARAKEAIAEFDIRTPSATVHAGTLSGGNQQKAVVAREFSRKLTRARAGPAHPRPRRRQHRVHPQAGDCQARRRGGNPARLGGARRGHGDIRPGRRDVPRRDRRARRRTHRGARGDRPADGDRAARSGGARRGDDLDDRRPAAGPGRRRVSAGRRRERIPVRTARKAYALSIVPIISILLALLCGAVLIILSSPASQGQIDLLLPIKAYNALLEGATGISFLEVDDNAATLAISLIPDTQALTNTLVAAGPLVLTGLAVGVGFKAGLVQHRRDRAGPRRRVLRGTGWLPRGAAAAG